MKKVLWLASWYPDSRDPYEGDFVQRHARATALYCNVHVISARPMRTDGAVYEKNQEDNLTQEVYYYKEPTGKFASSRGTLCYVQTLLKGVSNYIREHGKPSFIHVHVLMKAGLAAWWLKKTKGIPYCLTEHYNIYDPIRDDAYQYRSKPYKTAVAQVAQNASGMISVSHYIANCIKTFAPNLKHERVINTVDINLFHPKPHGNQKFRFIHVSTLRYGKNAEGLFEAFKKLYDDNKNVELIVFGAVKPSLVDYAKKLGIADAVIFYGEIPYKEVASKMQESDAFVLFSRWENMPCVIIEAMAVGLPIVTTNVGGIAEVINERNGILVDNENVQQMYEAMKKVLEGKFNYDSQAVSDFARNTYNYEVIGKEMFDAYYKLGFLS